MKEHSTVLCKNPQTQGICCTAMKKLSNICQKSWRKKSKNNHNESELFFFLKLILDNILMVPMHLKKTGVTIRVLLGLSREWPYIKLEST